MFTLAVGPPAEAGQIPHRVSIQVLMIFFSPCNQSIDQVGHQKTAIHINNVCNLLSDHWVVLNVTHWIFKVKDIVHCLAYFHAKHDAVLLMVWQQICRFKVNVSIMKVQILQQFVHVVS